MAEEKEATVADIAEADVSEPKPDSAAYLEQKSFEHEENMQKTELGWVGKIWGSRSEKPGNISAIVALILVIYLGFLLFSDSPADVFDEKFAGITSIITLILGYLFGSNDRRP